MAFLIGLPSAVPTPRLPTPAAGRYAHTNPLRREHGLRILCESLPDPLHWALIRAWRCPNRYTTAGLDLPTQDRPHPDDAVLRSQSPDILACFTLIALELARRMVEAPKERLYPARRNAMLADQSVYLRRLYDALAVQIGGPAALDEFERLIACVV